MDEAIVDRRARSRAGVDDLWQIESGERNKSVRGRGCQSD